MRVSLLAALALLPAALHGQAAVIIAAESALAAGQPWRTTTLLAPVVNVPATRTPDAVILAARAATAWRGWTTVRTLLARESWLDSRFDRLGRRLLAEASLGDQQLQQALVHARAAMPTSDGRRDRGEQARRFLILARVQDRLDLLDSASTNYQRAAALLPEVTDWLLLRAAGLTRDSSERATLYARIQLPAAKPRIPWTEALAYDRLKEYERSAMHYQRLGAPVAALKVAWKGATTESSRQAISGSLMGMLTPQLSLADTREAIDLLVTVNPALSRDDQLVVARRAAVAGRTQQVVDYFAAAARTAPLDPADQFAWATALGTLKKWPEALRQFRAISDSLWAGPAAYQAARAQLRTGDETGAIAALQSVIRRYPNDTVAAGTAIYLLGDLAIDAGRPDSARTLFRLLSERFPTSPFRSRALIAAAIVAFENGEPAAAARELAEGLVRNPPAGIEADAYRYWLGRAQLLGGDTIGARTTLRSLLIRGPENYYALQAAARLDTLPWTIPVAPEPVVPKALEANFRRVTLLESLNLDVEARFELDRIAGEAVGAPALVQTAEAFAAAGYPARTQQVALRAQTAGAPRDGILMRLLYPLPFSQLLTENAKREGVDPFLAAGVIRQESGFDPRALSKADARGLMQVLPSVGEEMARGTFPGAFDPAMLYIPDVNLSFGMQHFALALTKYPETQRALAAYNAGQSPVDRWSQTLLGGTPIDSVSARLPDVEMFVERIPYVETRDYVRNIMRNLSVYRLLYGTR